MFRSRRRDIIVPQVEHARLASLIAGYWGNEKFALPAIGRERFVRAVAEHERGYGDLDQVEVLAADIEDWLDVRRRTIRQSCGDAYIDMLVALHNDCLMREVDDQRCAELAAEGETILSSLSAMHPCAISDLQRVLSMVQLCDLVSYRVCLGSPGVWQHLVFPSDDSPMSELVEVRLESEDLVILDPWPLHEERVTLAYRAYKADGYPGVLHHQDCFLTVTSINAFTDRMTGHDERESQRIAEGGEGQPSFNSSRHDPC